MGRYHGDGKFSKASRKHVDCVVFIKVYIVLLLLLSKWEVGDEQVESGDKNDTLNPAGNTNDRDKLYMSPRLLDVPHSHVFADMECLVLLM